MNSSYLNQIIAKLEELSAGGEVKAESLLVRLGEIVEDIANTSDNEIYAYQSRLLGAISLDIAELTGPFRGFLKIIPGYYGRAHLSVRDYGDGDHIALSAFVNMQYFVSMDGFHKTAQEPTRTASGAYSAIKKLLANAVKNTIFVDAYIHGSDYGSHYGTYSSDSEYAKLFHKRHHCARRKSFNPKQVAGIDFNILTFGALGVSKGY